MKTLNKKKKADKVDGIDKTAASSGIDSVKMMRDIRNKISSETWGMSYEQFTKYISVKLKYQRKS